MTDSPHPNVIWLDQTTASDVSAAGGKGANLGELVRAGLPVPNGFIVTTAAYDSFISENALAALITDAALSPDAADAIGVLFQHAAMSPALVDELAQAYANLTGDARAGVAVRSSATAEDLPTASFAGQQDTYLNVYGTSELLAAVRNCWASLWTQRAISYRSAADRTHLTGASLSIAVVVQLMVPSDVSGVLFTANPTNGHRDETVVTASWGLGEAVVGGLVDPDAYVASTSTGELLSTEIADKAVMTVAVDGGTAEVSVPDDQRTQSSLTGEQVTALADLGRRIQEHFGAPQDIEWAIADDRIWILQARPITALPEPSGPVPTEWPLPRAKSLYFRASIVEQLPDPLTPLFADLVATAVPEGLNALLSELRPGLEPMNVAFPTINGYAYYDYDTKSMNRMWSFTPAGLKLLFTEGFVLRRWQDRELPRYRATVASWDTDPTELSASELFRGTQELLNSGCLYYTTVQSIIPIAAMTEMTWTALYDRALKVSGGPAASDFLLGFESTPMDAEKSLHNLAASCRRAPDLSAALQRIDATALAGPAPEGVDLRRWIEFQSRLQQHLARYGHTIYNLDFVNPVPADDPTPILEALRYMLTGRAVDPFERQKQTVATRVRITRELLERLDPVRRGIARKALKPAQDWAPIRENALAALGLAWPCMRRFLHELGRRLTDAGATGRPADVYWLTSDELAALVKQLDEGSTALESYVDAIADRRATWHGQLKATPPQYLPVNAVMNLMGNMMPARNETQTGPVIKGTGGSGGIVTGPARVLAGPEDFGSFRPGEILVAPITTPAFTPLFAMAAGVVTDIGGVLSHGSIVAREYGIPAVLGTGVATRRIATGDTITVDGNAGTVALDEPEHEASETPPHKALEIARGHGSWLAAGAVALTAVGVAVWRRTH